MAVEQALLLVKILQGICILVMGYSCAVLWCTGRKGLAATQGLATLGLISFSYLVQVLSSIPS